MNMACITPFVDSWGELNEGPKCSIAVAYDDVITYHSLDFSSSSLHSSNEDSLTLSISTQIEWIGGTGNSSPVCKRTTREQ